MVVHGHSNHSSACCQSNPRSHFSLPLFGPTGKSWDVPNIFPSNIHPPLYGHFQPPYFAILACFNLKSAWNPWLWCQYPGHLGDLYPSQTSLRVAEVGVWSDWPTKTRRYVFSRSTAQGQPIFPLPSQLPTCPHSLIISSSPTFSVSQCLLFSSPGPKTCGLLPAGVLLSLDLVFCLLMWASHFCLGREIKRVEVHWGPCPNQK